MTAGEDENPGAIEATLVASGGLDHISSILGWNILWTGEKNFKRFIDGKARFAKMFLFDACLVQICPFLIPFGPFLVQFSPF